MIDDILYDPLFFVFEVPDISTNGTIQGISYDGNNFIVGENGLSSGEIVSIFIN
jgi:hypothetical protein